MSVGLLLPLHDEEPAQHASSLHRAASGPSRKAGTRRSARKFVLALSLFAAALTLLMAVSLTFPGEAMANGFPRISDISVTYTKLVGRIGPVDFPYLNFTSAPWYTPRAIVVTVDYQPTCVGSPRGWTGVKVRLGVNNFVEGEGEELGTATLLEEGPTWSKYSIPISSKNEAGILMGETYKDKYRVHGLWIYEYEVSAVVDYEGTCPHGYPRGVFTGLPLVVYSYTWLPLQSLVPPRFMDVGPTHKYTDAINGMREMGLIGGYQVGDESEFRPQNPVLRAQFAKMSVGALALQLPEEGGSLPFSDLGSDDPANPYPHQHVAAAYSQGIIRGKTPTSFAPWANVTRSQAVTMMVRALQNLYPGLLQPVPAGYAGSWGSSYDSEQAPLAALAEYNGLLEYLDLTGTAKDPFSPMPRQEVAQILWNVMLKPVLTVTGTATDPATGYPLAGTVFLADKDGHWLEAAEPDENGDYSLELRLGRASGWTKEGLPCLVGMYRDDGDSFYWDESNPLGSGIPDDVRVLNGNVHLDLSATNAPSDYTIYGWVTESDSGGPLGGVLITAVQQGVADPAEASAVTDGNGYYEIPHLPAGSYIVWATYGDQAQGASCTVGQYGADPEQQLDFDFQTPW